MRLLYKLNLGLLSSTLLFLPSVTFAAGLQNLVSDIARLIDRIIPIMMAVALIVFMWGIIKLIGADSDDGRTEGKQRMLWGIIALFVLVSIWGITRYIGSTLGIGRQGQMNAPDYPRFSGGGESGGGDGYQSDTRPIFQNQQYDVELNEFEPL